MNKREKQLRKKWLDAIEMIDNTRSEVINFWHVKHGDVIAANDYSHRHNEFIVDSVEIIFDSEGFPEFVARGRLIKSNGKPGKRTAHFYETIEDGWDET